VYCLACQRTRAAVADLPWTAGGLSVRLGPAPPLRPRREPGFSD
jgi:hypothetical protein